MSSGELSKRVAVSALGIPVALLAVHLGGWYLTVLLALIAGLGAREYFRLARAVDISALKLLGMAGSVAMVLLAGGLRTFPAAAPWAMGILIGVFLGTAGAAVWLRWPRGNPLSAVPVTLSGILYTGGTLSFAIFLRHLPEDPTLFSGTLPYQGPLLLILPLAVTWSGDSAAYFLGVAFGNRKLIPAVSPGKTVVGGVGGLAASALVGGIMGGTVLQLHPTPWASALVGGAMGAVLGVVAQVGDLVESVMKREARVKDSGTLLPGHGGILDRFDALFFTLPLAYALVRATELLH